MRKSRPTGEADPLSVDTSERRRSTQFILVLRGLRSLAYGFLAIILGVVLAGEGFSPVAIDVLITVSLVGDMVGTYVIGLVTDTWGRRRTLALLSLLMAGTGLIFGLVTSYPVLLVAAFIGTLGTSASETAPFLPIDKAMIAQVTAPECRTALFARYNLIASGSSAGGALVAGLPASTPTSIPIPTPTPRLAHSMTQVLTTFCDAITTQDYQTAWNQYASSLQHTHPQPETFAAWRKFTRCTIPDQSGDPSALTVLTLTFAHGYTDRFGRSGDVDYRLTMGVEDKTWKITGVCDILSEGRLLCGQLGLERRMCAYERDRGESG